MASPYLTRTNTIANAAIAGSAITCDLHAEYKGNDALLECLCERHAAELERINNVVGDISESTFMQLHAIEEMIAATPAETMRGVAVKSKWIEHPNNYNNGCLGPEYVNGKVLLSLLADIKRLSAH